MKKTIVWIIFALVSGALLGKLTFDRYEKLDTQNVISYDNYVYLLKYGTYKTLDEMSDAITELDRYIYIEKNDKVDAYVAIAKTKENASKIKFNTMLYTDIAIWLKPNRSHVLYTPRLSKDGSIKFISLQFPQTNELLQ